MIGKSKRGDKAHFVTLALTELKALHAGNAVRFGIGPLEWAGQFMHPFSDDNGRSTG